MIRTFDKGRKTMLSQNFVSTEFDCKGKGCCSITKVDSDLVDLLQQVRNRFGCAVRINSGFRCSKHNKAVGGAKSSKHMSGMAADIVAVGVDTAKVAAFLEECGAKGIMRYISDGFVHVDTRSRKYFAEVKNGVTKSVNTFGGQICPYKKPQKLISIGSRGEGVKYVQFKLNRLGINCGNVDGICGVKTVAAIKAFQKKSNLKCDGIAGPKTLAIL